MKTDFNSVFLQKLASKNEKQSLHQEMMKLSKEELEKLSLDAEGALHNFNLYGSHLLSMGGHGYLGYRNAKAENELADLQGEAPTAHPKLRAVGQGALGALVPLTAAVGVHKGLKSMGMKPGDAADAAMATMIPAANFSLLARLPATKKLQKQLAQAKMQREIAEGGSDLTKTSMQKRALSLRDINNALPRYTGVEKAVTGIVPVGLSAMTAHNQGRNPLSGAVGGTLRAIAAPYAGALVGHHLGDVEGAYLGGRVAPLINTAYEVRRYSKSKKKKKTSSVQRLEAALEKNSAISMQSVTEGIKSIGSKILPAAKNVAQNVGQKVAPLAQKALPAVQKAAPAVQNFLGNAAQRVGQFSGGQRALAAGAVGAASGLLKKPDIDPATGQPRSRIGTALKRGAGAAAMGYAAPAALQGAANLAGKAPGALQSIAQPAGQQLGLF